MTSVSPTSTSDLRAQLDAVLSDIGTDALKTGMIPSAHLAMVGKLLLSLAIVILTGIEINECPPF